MAIHNPSISERAFFKSEKNKQIQPILARRKKQLPEDFSHKLKARHWRLFKAISVPVRKSTAEWSTL